MQTRRETLVALGAIATAGLGGCAGRGLPDSVELHKAGAQALFDDRCEERSDKLDERWRSIQS